MELISSTYLPQRRAAFALIIFDAFNGKRYLAKKRKIVANRAI
jgi:hypothetical protein